MSEKNGKMKFKIGVKIVDDAEGKCAVKVIADCPPEFIVSAIAKILVHSDNKVVAAAIKEGVALAVAAENFPYPSEMVDKLLRIKSSLQAGTEGNLVSGIAGLSNMMSLLDDIAEAAKLKTE